MIDIEPIDLTALVRRNARIRFAVASGNSEEFDNAIADEIERLKSTPGDRSGDEHPPEPGS